MCTVTFIALRRGYRLGMNRDEQRSRASGLPPRLHRFAQREALCPSEPSGGTWIGVDPRGVGFALINWYAIPARPHANAASRGQIIPALLAAPPHTSAHEVLAALPLARIRPFRLIAIDPNREQVTEWRWDLHRLQAQAHPWSINTWISSGHDEPGAQQQRGLAFQQAQRADDVGSRAWLRRLHRSHENGPGPYSHCMHRPEAVTVSYTEMEVAAGRVTMSYLDGSPCACQAESTRPGFTHASMVQQPPAPSTPDSSPSPSPSLLSPQLITGHAVMTS